MLSEKSSVSCFLKGTKETEGSTFVLGGVGGKAYIPQKTLSVLRYFIFKVSNIFKAVSNKYISCQAKFFIVGGHYSILPFCYPAVFFFSSDLYLVFSILL